MKDNIAVILESLTAVTEIVKKEHITEANKRIQDIKEEFDQKQIASENGASNIILL